MSTKLLIVPADFPEDADKITVTITSTQTTDRGRVLRVLAHLFSTGDEWDGTPPNVELIAEHVEESV